MNNKKLKQLKPESLNLPASVKIYINEILCTYYKNYGQNARNNGSIRVKFVKENVSTITNDCDLERLFHGDSLIADPIRFFVDQYDYYLCFDIFLGYV